MDFFHAWFLMDSKFATRLPFEVLHRIRDIDVASIDPSFLQTLIEKLSGWSNKRAAFLILTISRLLADHHD